MTRYRHPPDPGYVVWRSCRGYPNMPVSKVLPEHKALALAAKLQDVAPLSDIGQQQWYFVEAFEGKEKAATRALVAPYRRQAL